MLVTVAVILLCLVARAYAVSLPSRPPKRDAKATRSVAALLGSGGHTSELIALLSALPPERYTPRTYILSSGDSLSLQKALALESSFSSASPAYKVLTLPRLRKVHQPLPLALPRIAYSLLFTLYHLTLLPALRFESFSDLIVLNGPGTAVAVVIAVWVSRFFGLPSPRLVYIESFARVRSLSVTAKLVRPFVDRFVTQWPEALGSGKGRGECRGWLV